MKSGIYAFSIFAFLFHSGVSANTLYPDFSRQESGVKYGVGAGILVEDEGYKDIGRETNPFPVLYVETDRFRLLGPQATYRVFGDKKSNIALRADYRMEGYEEEDGPVFVGMEERKGALAIGLSGQLDTGYGELLFSLTKQTSASDGAYGTLQMAWPLQRGAFTVTPRVGLEYYSEKFADYYFGVRANESTAQRPAYKVGSAVNPDFGVDVVWSISPKHQVLGSLKYRRYDQEIQDSPLVDSSGSPRMNFAYIYLFD